MTLKNEHTVRYTAEEMKGMVCRGESQTDWDRVRALTDEEVEASIDFEDEGEFEFSKVYTGPIVPDLMDDPVNWKTVVPVDADVATWFEAKGPDSRRRMNAVLRAYMEAEEREAS